MWRKAGALLGVAALGRDPNRAADAAAGCGHVHLPPPEAIDSIARWREAAGVVLAAGIRPCAGAIVVLVFALSQGVFAAGIAATFAMALGTALTTGALAASRCSPRRSPCASPAGAARAARSPWPASNSSPGRS